MKKYKYTLYRQDGTVEDLGVHEKWELEKMYEVLHTDIVEVIPREYSTMKGRYTLWGDEEGRFKETNHTNPHFKVLAFGYDVVGDILKEEVSHDE